jgi:hypothetical protein
LSQPIWPGGCNLILTRKSGKPMSHLNFSIHAFEARAQPKQFNPRSTVFVNGSTVSMNRSSVLWTVFAVIAVAGSTFAIVWFA